MQPSNFIDKALNVPLEKKKELYVALSDYIIKLRKQYNAIMRACSKRKFPTKIWLDLFMWADSLQEQIIRLYNDKILLSLIISTAEIPVLHEEKQS